MIVAAAVVVSGCTDSGPTVQKEVVGGDARNVESEGIVASGDARDPGADVDAASAQDIIPLPDQLPEIDAATALDTNAPDICPPSCSGKVCGDDGCGGSCGVCTDPAYCLAGDCVSCGDGLCNPGEDQCNCPDDCDAGCNGCCFEAECHVGDEAEFCGVGGGECKGCLAGQVCLVGECFCIPEQDKVCSDGDVYWVDSCDGIGEKKEECGDHACKAATCQPPICPDGFCNGDETTCSCPEDCGTCAGCCTGAVCEAGELDLVCGTDGASCQDCAAMDKTCSDSMCQCVCGDGLCCAAEKCLCPEDCGTCCGNGWCDLVTGENHANCPEDCQVLTEGFVQIEAGSFWMGSPDGDCPEGYPPESCIEEPGGTFPLHYVTLTRAFEMGMNEVTQGEWKAAFDWNPSGFPGCGDNCPVESITWYDAIAYANWLSEQAFYSACFVFSDVVCEDTSEVGTAYEECLTDSGGGIAEATVSLTFGVDSVYDCEGYRLPTEAEREYAARASSLTAFHPSPGNDGSITFTECAPPDMNLVQIAWYVANASWDYKGDEDDCYDPWGDLCFPACGPHEVGLLEANPWGLKDMSGNVSEWCWDKQCYGEEKGELDPAGPDCDTSQRMSKGAGWADGAYLARNASAVGWWAYKRNTARGLRLVRTLP